jgi:predicted GH43/DUF377 family glycosyl hydrolase
MFNPSLEVYSQGGEPHLVSLVRAFGKDDTTTELQRNEGVSRFFRADFTDDGMTLASISEEPVFAPMPGELDVEDARTTLMEVPYGPVYCVTYTSTRVKHERKLVTGPAGFQVYRQVPTVVWKPAIALTEDFASYRRLPELDLPRFSKDFVVFPRTVNGDFVCLYTTRVPEKKADDPEVGRFYSENPGIWIAYSKDLVHWYGHKEILKPSDDELRIGPGAPPIETEEGWLILYHTMSKRETDAEPIRVYKARAALLNRHDPSQVDKVAPSYLLTPQKEFELHNPEIPDLEHVFVEGAVYCGIQNGTYIPGFLMAYGAADRHCARALASREFMMDSLRPVERG